VSGMLNRIFGLDALAFGEEGVRLLLARPLPAWGWALAALGAGAFAWWSYRRLVGPARPRAALAGLRALLILMLALLIAGPQLVRSNEREEPDWVVMLIDRSASLTVRDAEDGASSREEQLKGAIEANAATWAQLGEKRELVWLGFAGGAFELQEEGPTPGLGEPDGRRTNIGRALEDALARAAARPVAGIVLLSDGRSHDRPSRAVLRALQGERTGVYAVPLGSPEAVGDLSVERVDAPRLAFAGDTVPVRVRVGRYGEAGAGTVRLVDAATGQTLDEAAIEGDEVVLTHQPRDAGARTWAIQLIPEGADLLDDNNLGELRVEISDRPVRVLHLDGYPRWEYRYIKNLLLRERSIVSSSLLIAANRRYIQEGDTELATLPRTLDEWEPFDTIVLGDVHARQFSEEQLDSLRRHVAENGAGLLWVAGDGPTPSSWLDTPLAPLLPFVAGADVSPWTEPVTMRRTEAAERLGALRLEDRAGEGWPAPLADPDTGWSRLRWAQRLDPDRLKPTAEVLATGVPMSSWPATAGESPLVVSMRYGAGRSVYVATDEIWRWRYARGEALPERFWLGLVRLLGRTRLERAGKPAVLDVSPPQAEVERPVRISLRLLDQSLLEAGLRSTPVGIGGAGQRDELTLTGEDGRLAATWSTTEPGIYRIEPLDPLLASLGLSATVEVSEPSRELREPATDHALLAELAGATEGRVLSIDELADLPSMLPNRSLRIEGEPDIQTLWDRPFVLALIVLLLTAEWIGRKLVRLV
jgi:hypothetical protein